MLTVQMPAKVIGQRAGRAMRPAVEQQRDRPARCPSLLLLFAPVLPALAAVGLKYLAFSVAKASGRPRSPPSASARDRHAGKRPSHRSRSRRSLARLDADGYVTITGRWKDVLVQGGLDPRRFALETIGSACEPIENGTAAGKSLSMSAHGMRQVLVARTVGSHVRE
jgi:hypothetical protein